MKSVKQKNCYPRSTHGASNISRGFSRTNGNKQTKNRNCHF